MAPSIARQAWVFCCNTVCSERVLSPVLVLLVHALLVADVTYHRRELWEDMTLWYRSVRLLVLATIALYIGTSCTNPGFVESQPETNRSCNCFLLCCALCMGEKMAAKKHLSTDSTTSTTNLDADEGTQMTVIDEGIQKRRGNAEDLEVDADQEGWWPNQAQ